MSKRATKRKQTVSMMTVSQYKEIAKIKDSNPFTKDIPLSEYIEGVRSRMGIVMDVNPKSISLGEIYEQIVKDS